MNQAPAHIGQRELRDEQLFPFEAAVRRAGHRQRHARLLRRRRRAVPRVGGAARPTILRGEWGFDGIVASDYIGVEMISTAHQLTSDLGEAARLALVAGVDAELPRTVAFGAPLEAALEAGRVDDADLDATVARVLRMKFRLGLFEQPYVPIPGEDVLESARRGRGARRPGRSPSARWSWSRTTGSCRSRPARRRVAVIGPIADSARDLLGDYSHLVHMETLREMHDGTDALGHRRRGRGDRAGRRADRAADHPRGAPRRAPGRRHPLRARGPASPTGPTRRSPRPSRRRPRPRSRSWSSASAPA